MKSALIQVLLFDFFTRTVPSMAVKLADCCPIFPVGRLFFPNQSVTAMPAFSANFVVRSGKTM